MSSMYRYFSSLAPRTRLIIGGGLIAYGLAGSFLTDKAEEAFDLVPTNEDRQRLKSLIPKITVVEKEEDGTRIDMERLRKGR